MCAEEMWMQVSPQPHKHPPPPQSCIFHCSLLFSLLIWGLMAIDSGLETNGFWFLGQEILPGKVGG